MFGFIATIILLFAEAGHGAAKSGAWESFKHFYNDWFNVPGFEAWKFLNLAIFIALMTYFVKKPLSDAFKARREQIREELIRAEEEKQAALVRLTSAEAKLAQLETEKETILQRAKDEAAFEKKRLADQTAVDVERLRSQTDAELARTVNQTRAELRRFSAVESIRLAEEKLRKQIDGKTDAKLVKSSIAEIGGLS